VRTARFDHSITDYFIPLHNDEQNVANLLLAPEAWPTIYRFFSSLEFHSGNLVIINVQYDEKAKPTELANDMSLALIKCSNNLLDSSSSNQSTTWVKMQELLQTPNPIKRHQHKTQNN
jgi:hypothetical protein